MLSTSPLSVLSGPEPEGEARDAGKVGQGAMAPQDAPAGSAEGGADEGAAPPPAPASPTIPIPAAPATAEPTAPGTPDIASAEPTPDAASLLGRPSSELDGAESGSFTVFPLTACASSCDEESPPPSVRPDDLPPCEQTHAAPAPAAEAETSDGSPAIPTLTSKSLFQKTLEFTAGDGHLKELEEIEQCSICLDDFTDDDPAKVTLCGHRYHLQCVMQWRQRSDECPMCLRTLRWVDPETEELVEALAAPEPFVVGSAPEWQGDSSPGAALLVSYMARSRAASSSTATQPPQVATRLRGGSDTLSTSAPAHGFFGKMSALFRGRGLRR